MTRIKPGSVVVGADGSSHADSAVTWAVTYAALHDRPLLIVNATGWVSPHEVFTSVAEVRQARRIAARRLTDAAMALAQRVVPGQEIDTLTPHMDPRQALLDLSGQASMVVVGTRGHGPVTSLLLGSVSVAVATHAECPVAVVRPREEPVEGIVVGVSGDGSDQAALEFAAELASAEGQPLDAVHAWQTGGSFIDEASYAQRMDTRERHQHVLTKTLSGLDEKYPDVQINPHLADDGPVGALVERSGTAGAVVVGSRGRTSKVALIGSVSRAVVEHADSTVVVVRG